MMDTTPHAETPAALPGLALAARRRLIVLTLLCIPGLVASSTLAVDSVTSSSVGSALTTWGFLGGLVGLAGLFSGFASIVAWPAVLVLTLKSVRMAGLGTLSRVGVVLGCVVATYSAAFFIVWFVVFPLLVKRAG
jgi:hypothetical protein